MLAGTLDQTLTRAKSLASYWVNSNSALLKNAVSLVGTAGITYGLGFVYWWVAARLFPANDVGLASASTTSMMFLGNMGMLGLGTLLIGEMQRRKETRAQLVSAALMASAVVSAVLGLLFVVFIAFFSSEFDVWRASPLHTVVFCAGIALTSVTQILDQSLIGLLKGKVQFRRNAFFAIGKLVLLFVLGTLFHGSTSGVLIYSAWLLGNVLSIVDLVIPYTRITSEHPKWRPQFSLLVAMRRSVIGHQVLNVMIDLPNFVLPTLITVLLSPRANAGFYIAWMIIGFNAIAPSALSAVLHAIGAGQRHELVRKLRVSFSLSFLIGLGVCVVMILGAKPILQLFGKAYADEAQTALQIMALGFFPRIVRVHYAALSRIARELAPATLVISLSSVLQIGLVALGASMGGLAYAAAGWLAAVYIETFFTIGKVVATAVNRPAAHSPMGEFAHSDPHRSR